MNSFEKGETRPFSNLVIEMRRSSRGYVWWVMGAILIIVFALAVLVKI